MEEERVEDEEDGEGIEEVARFEVGDGAGAGMDYCDTVRMFARRRCRVWVGRNLRRSNWQGGGGWPRWSRAQG